MQLARVILSVRSPKNLARFYRAHLGMRAWSEGDAIVLGYDGLDAALELRRAASDKTYAHARSDRYWKIGITLPDVDLAHAQLCDAGISVSDPNQFGDIGYMCHLCDPEGFVIELLQHRFQGNQNKAVGDPKQPLGGGARIGQITLRTNDLDQALAFYRDRLGMRLLSIQPVKKFGFTLYFLALTDERAPQAELTTISNREWLWQRPYTTLELQHFEGKETAFSLPEEGDPGFFGISISDSHHADTSLLDEAGGEVFIFK
jgi:catechol 2,3-dioxygenase-like lactoylglutathione lyase family enzyme